MSDEDPLGPYCPTCGAMHGDWIEHRAKDGKNDINRLNDAIEDQRSTIASQASALQRAAEQVERLTERCAAYKGQVEAGAHEIERLRTALERYGMHSVDCNTVMGWGHNDPCDCGFSGALNEQETKP